MSTLTRKAAAVAAMGTAQKLAAALGISSAAVSKWGDEIPYDRLIQVETVTNVPRELLRPELYRGSPPPSYPIPPSVAGN